MSHEISVVDGVEEAFYAKAPAWHQLGTVLDHTPTSKEAIVAAHLDWEVEKKKLYVKQEMLRTVNQNVLNDGTRYIEVPDKYATVRKDNHRILGTVGNIYQIVQNVDAFNFLDSLVYDGNLKYESAGALKDGSYIWMLARFPKEYAVTDDDVTRKYVLLVNSHDGSKRIRVLPTDIRVVCWNTMSFALKQSREMFVMRHTTKVHHRLEEVRSVLGILDATNQQIHDIMLGLAKKPVTKDKVTEYIESIFPLPTVKNKSETDKEKAETDKNITTRLKNIRSQVANNFDEMETKATNGTVYGLLNAVTQYTDHQSTVHGKDDVIRAGNRFNSIFFGSGSKLKEKAFKLARSM